MPKKLKINVGCTWDLRQIELISALNKSHTNTIVTDVYGSIGQFPTARSYDRLPKWDYKRFVDYIAAANKNNIGVKWTMNQSCLGQLDALNLKFYEDMIKQLKLYQCHKYIVVVPLLANIIKSMDPEAWIEVSTIGRTTSIQELQAWVKLGVNSICWDVMENRNFTLLQNAAKYLHDNDVQLEVIVNEFCLFMCVHRNTCYNLSSHNSSRDRFGGYPFTNCISARLDDNAEWLRARFVLPSWISHYDMAGVDQFKITGRTHSTDEVDRVLRYYMDEKDPEDLLSLWHHIEKLVPGTKSVHPTISCEKLNHERFLEHFEKKGHICKSVGCGIGRCTYCGEMFNYACVK